jgi:hypothetical protein
MKVKEMRSKIKEMTKTRKTFFRVCGEKAGEGAEAEADMMVVGGEEKKRREDAGEVVRLIP